VGSKVYMSSEARRSFTLRVLPMLYGRLRRVFVARIIVRGREPFRTRQLSDAVEWPGLIRLHG
jgi:hypothetical protein